MNIRPEDIPAELVENWLRDSVSGSWKDFIARRLNDAISQGVVSPPCWVYRYTGELQKSGGVVDLFPKRYFSDDQFGHHEHWKGQTE